MADRMSIRDEFQRTECGCEKCVTCCRHMPAQLAPGDVDLIHELVAPDATREEFLLENFHASPGYRAMRLRGFGSGTPVVEEVRVPTIVPQLREHGCVFLDDEGRCSVHAVAPWGCAYFDVHMDADIADERTRAGLAATQRDESNDGQYQRDVELLEASGKRAGPVEPRREAMKKAFESC